MKTLKEGCQVLASIMLLAISAPLLAQDYVDLENEDNQVAYSIGVNIGQNLVAQQIVEGIDLTAFMAGMLDALSDDVKMEQSVMMEVLQSFMQGQADEAQAALGESYWPVKHFLLRMPREMVLLYWIQGCNMKSWHPVVAGNHQQLRILC
jgi:hypothetical protein